MAQIEAQGELHGRSAILKSCKTVERSGSSLNYRKTS